MFDKPPSSPRPKPPRGWKENIVSFDKPSSIPRPKPPRAVRVKPAWTPKETNPYAVWVPHKTSKVEQDYWEKAILLMRMATSPATGAAEAASFLAKVEDHFAKRPKEFGDFPPYTLREFPVWATHPTRPTALDLRNKNRTKKGKGTMRPVPSEGTSSRRIRDIMLHHLWLAGQFLGWMNARQLMQYMGITNKDFFRANIGFATNYQYQLETIRSRNPDLGYDSCGRAFKKTTLYRIMTTPPNRRLPWPKQYRHMDDERATALSNVTRSVMDEQRVEDDYPKGYTRPLKFVLDVKLSLRMIDLVETPDRPVERPEYRLIQEVGTRWQSGEPGVCNIS